MKPLRLFATALIALLAGVLSAQDGPQKGRIKKIDADKSTVIVTSDGKDLIFQVTADTRVMNADGQQIDDLFKEKAFAVGAAVVFKADGQTLQGIKLQEGGAGKQPKDGAGIQRGKLVKIDLDKLTVTLKSGDKEIEAVAHEKTLFFEAKGDSVKEKLAIFKVGADVNFVVRDKDGKNELVGIRLFQEGPKKDGDKKAPPPLVKVDSSKLVPLNELGNKEYKEGFKGGFYPDGQNERPKSHEEAGLRLAKAIQPLNADGKPDPNGKIVMMSVGMSNTAQASTGFQRMLRSAEGINPQFVFVNGAVGGQTAAITQSTESDQGAKYWGIVDQRLKEAKLTREQVQIIWIKQADAAPGMGKTKGGFPGYAKDLENELANLVKIFPKRFPNAKLVYLSSRTYGGYAATPLNPEPYAYESAFSVKWLIERQIKGEADLNFDPKKGDVKAPWLSWGPYLWANGSTKRADGFSYEREDFSPKDGTHHTDTGSDKIGRLMVQFFRNDMTSRPWFVEKGK
jgi:Cu/Ag efflux protein CusF